jgi:glycosyltransferase involved in cell wall biosynthesis
MTESKLPKSVLYAVNARVGGKGFDTVALETLRGIYPILGRAVCYGLRIRDFDRTKVKSLQFHPVRLLSNLDSKYYYAAKKRAVDRVAAQLLGKGRYDLFHGWSGEAQHCLRLARAAGIPTVLEIPTWHRQKGRQLPYKTKEELADEREPVPARWLNRILISRHESLEEYELADLIVVLSEKAAETFRVLGVPADKLYWNSHGVDADEFTPGVFPDRFRAVFVGALIKRKGVHHLIEAWKTFVGGRASSRAGAWPQAELWLVGHPHEEIRPYLEGLPSNVRVLGFTRDIPSLYRQCTVHVFPSECEGSAKSVCEAAACGLPQITTRESGDIVVDGVNGLIVPPNNPEAIVQALRTLSARPDLICEYGRAARERALKLFTWNHYRERLLGAYRAAMERCEVRRQVGQPFRVSA